MLVRNIGDCQEIAGGDETRIRELLHPKNEPLTLGYSLAHAELDEGLESLRHSLKGSSEVYYILEGRGLMMIDGEEREVGAGDAVLIPEGAEQFIRNIGRGTLKFLCIVEPAWSGENESIFGDETSQ